jgi:hypothetical protein
MMIVVTGTLREHLQEDARSWPRALQSPRRLPGKAQRRPEESEDGQRPGQPANSTYIKPCCAFVRNPAQDEALVHERDHH